MPGYACLCASAAMARVKALSTAGFVAVSFAAASASGGAPASPLLKCSSKYEFLEAANNALARSCCCASLASSEAGSHNDSQPQMNQPHWPASPFHHALIGAAPGRSSKLKVG